MASEARLSRDITIDVPRLIETRLLIQAQSGAGKSWALRRILEQTAPHVQQLVLDPEGEFATLREKFDYVIAAPRDADAVAHPRTASLLARRLLEHGASAILDIYDLPARDRHLFVQQFLGALLNAPRKLWHPCIVVVDEAHIFCAEKSQAESTAAVIDLATRGRKRGLCALLATQRLSKLHKDAAAECLNKMIGRTGLDVDVARAKDELGITNKQEAMRQLRGLGPGEFFVFGPALCTGVERTKVGPVQTTHPKVGQRLLKAPPAPSSKLRKLLGELADLPKEAEEEARTVAELRQEITQLRRRTTQAEKQAPAGGVPEAEVQKRIRKAVAEARAQSTPGPRSTDAEKALTSIVQTAQRALAKLEAVPKTASSYSDSIPGRAPMRERSSTTVEPAEGLTGPQQRIVDAIAWLESIGVDEPEHPAVAFMANYSYNSGGYNNARGRLNQQGLIQYTGDGRVRLTDAGRAVANFPAQPATNAELHERVLAKLPGPCRRLLQQLLAAYPLPMTNEQLATAAGYAINSGGYNNARGRLRSLGLVDYPEPGHVVARALLFPEGGGHD